MATGWTSTRALTSGPSPRDAAIGIVDDTMGYLDRRGDQEISDLDKATYLHQTSNAEIAMMKERQAVFSKMTTDYSKNPGAASQAFATEKETIRKRVLDGVTQPRAKEVTATRVDEILAQWEIELGHWGEKREAENAEIDYTVHRDDILKGSVQYGDESDMLENLASAFRFADVNHNREGLPVHADVATDEALTATKRAFTEKIAGDYLYQQALATGDETIIDRANEFVESRGIFEKGHGEKPVFGPEKIAALKKRIKQSADAAKLEAKAREEKIIGEATTGTWQKLQDPGYTFDKMVADINALPPEVTLEERDKLLSLTMKIKGQLAEGKQGPLQVRQDYGAYKELLFKSVDGTGTESEIRTAVNDGKISIGDYQYLRSVQQGEAGARSGAGNMADALRSVDRMVDEKLKDNDVKEVAKTKIHMLLEDAKKASEATGKPMSGRDLLLEGIRIERQVEREADANEEEPETLLPTPPKRKVGQTYTTPYDTEIGTYETDTTIRLNDIGVRNLTRYAKQMGWTRDQARNYAKKKGYIIP